MSVLRAFVVWCCTLGLSSLAQAEGASEYLQRFLETSSSVKAQFVQRVYLPSKNAQPGRIKQSSGSVEWSRPGKFRFDYQKPYVQTLVGNGRTVWFHDPDLAQVQVRQQQDLMRQSPMAWLIQTLPTAAQLQSWNARFVQTSETGFTRLQLEVPASPQTPAQMFVLDFGAQGLQRIETRDPLGQRFEVLLTDWQNGVPFPDRRFEFVIPPATEVIRP